MPGLVPGIHGLSCMRRNTWMAGTSPATTKKERSLLPLLRELIERHQLFEQRRHVFEMHHVRPVGRRAVGILMRLHEDRGDAHSDRCTRQDGNELSFPS